MKFGNSKVHEDITDAIRSTLLPYGIQGLRADDKQYSDDLFPNVMTYMHGCGFGIAVFERIDADEFNPNVSLEVGYMLALRKSVCLLSDKTLKKMQTDLVGKLYSPFDTYDILNTINAQLSKWLLAKSIAS
jgi:nucleoside 2-deoxyribosyltransferase